MYELRVEASFDAAHCLREYDGPCGRLHGHTYRVQVVLQGQQLSPSGMLVDFREAKCALNDVVQRFDHRLLNEVPPFTTLNPTAENLARHFYEELRQVLGACVARVTVWESPSSCASYWEEGG
ncbi:MAG: 6-carboxytetrahydropterin synthase QueD [Armatimonadota bacterium]